MADNDGAEPKKGEAENQSPSSESEGQDQKKTEAPLKLPEKFEGKSPEEIAKTYLELEKKLGEQSKEVEEARQIRENQKVLAQAIYADPKVVKKLEENIRLIQRGESLSTQTPSEEDDSGSKEDGEAKAPRQDDDLRRVTENRIIEEFSAKYGINDFEPEKRKDIMNKVGRELADMVDPGGKKGLSQILTEVRLDKLPRMLEKAYILVSTENTMSNSGGKGAQSQDLASIGRMPSSSLKSEGSRDSLTDSEIEVAKKLGIKPENYLKRKQEINNN